MPGLPWKSDLISEVFPGKIKVQILQFSFKSVFVYVIVGRIKELSQLCYSSHLQTLFFPFEAWWRKCYGWGYVLVSRRNLTKLLEEHQIDNLVLERQLWAGDVRIFVIISLVSVFPGLCCQSSTVDLTSSVLQSLVLPFFMSGDLLCRPFGSALGFVVSTV